MSLAGLVEYGSSDESNDEEAYDEISKNSETIKTINNKVDKDNTTNSINTVLENTKIDVEDSIKINNLSENVKVRLGSESEKTCKNVASNKLHLEYLPKPKSVLIDDDIIEDDIPVSLKKIEFEKPPKKIRAPVLVTIPSLSEFVDLDEEDKQKKKSQPSQSSSGLIALLPPPKDELLSTSNLVPQSVTRSKPTTVKTSLTPSQIKQTSQMNKSTVIKNTTSNNIQPTSTLNLQKYNSDSEDEDTEIINDTAEKKCDFFSLSESVNISLSAEDLASNILPMTEPRNSTVNAENDDKSKNSGKKLMSTVMNLPKDAIILKNKAEVGPKLPVPEQEFNVDEEGNLAFDDKALEYLCGKRGIKRKHEIINKADIIDINGDDIKPNEQEWLVKALTEEPAQRPVSLGSGPSGQSKKKHQITYLAHKAKAMEVELNNQWAANKLARRQTQSKYGF